jgi:hypothetical protein
VFEEILGRHWWVVVVAVILCVTAYKIAALFVP